MKEIVLVGFGGHGKSVADCIERRGEYRIVGYTDLSEHPDSPYPYLGSDEALEKVYADGVHRAALCIGYLGKGTLRETLYAKLKTIGYELPVIMDPTAVVATSAMLGEGCFVGKMAVINTDAKVGKMAIINTKALVEHDCAVGDFTHVAVGAVLCGGVTVGEACMIGANATVIQARRVGSRAVIGAGAVLTSDLEDGMLFRHQFVNVIKKNG